MRRRRFQAWQYLIGLFAFFWIVFAVILIVGQLPFYIISVALTTTLVMGILIIALAWAYQNNF